MKKISLDFDNVLWDFEQINIRLAKELYGVNMTSAAVTHWNYYVDEFPLIVPAWSNWEEYKTAEFFKGDQDFVKELQKKYEVQIITASTPEIAENKDKLIYERYGDIKIVHTKDKALYSGDSILVDDALHNVKAHIQAHNQPAIIVDRGYGWNQGFSDKLVRRAKCFDTILKEINYFTRGY